MSITKADAIRVVSQLIDFCSENGLSEFEDDLYSLLDAIGETKNEKPN